MPKRTHESLQSRDSYLRPRLKPTGADQPKGICHGIRITIGKYRYIL
jgi:hypothetical protein